MELWKEGTRLAFSDTTFLLYFLPATVLVHFAVGFSRRVQNLWLFLSGLVFCAFGEPVLALALLASVFVCTALGLAIERTRARGTHKALPVTALACAFPVGLLLLVRYAPMFFPGLPWAAEVVVADGFLPFMRPLGISFFTLQALSYLLDVSRGDAAAEQNPVAVGLSLAFFPRLLAGPFLRHAEIAPRLRERRVTRNAFSDGICRFVAGLGKTALLAYPLRQAADYVFHMSAASGDAAGGASVPVTLARLGVAAYALQIYHGFSGCSDMAAGLCRMFGFPAEKNFDYPYAAGSVTGFHRRWHISLSAWFRLYLWPPFDSPAGADGGRAAQNSLMVWLLIGLWYGAGLTFILWGLWHFFWITAEHVIRLDRRRLPAIARRVYVWATVGIGWIFFRAPDLQSAFSYLRNALGLNQNGFFGGAVPMLLWEYWPFLLAGVLFAAPLAPRFRALAAKRSIRGRLTAALYPVAFAALFAGSLIYLVRAGGAIWI
jgi:D-alanyl-lipoteichoic acid acyltransferase DltB (MBOAT superfamily)